MDKMSFAALKRYRKCNFTVFPWLIGIVLIGVQFFLPDYGVYLLIRVLIFSMFAMSLDLLVGYLGYPCFGQAAFWGVSGYTSAILIKKGLVEGAGSFWLVMPAGVLSGTVAAAILGLILFRIRGIYFFMVTLAMGMVFYAIAWVWRPMTGGDDGLVGIPRPDIGLPLPMGNDRCFYYFILLFFALSFFLLFRIVRSPFGHALVGIRESEARMVALGHNVWLKKYLCFILSASFSGLAGTLWVYFLGSISPLSLHVSASGLVFLAVIVGGSGTLFGPAIGALIVTLVEFVVSMYTGYSTAILGGIFVMTIMFFPKGVGGYLASRWKGLRIMA